MESLLFHYQDDAIMVLLSLAKKGEFESISEILEAVQEGIRALPYKPVGDPPITLEAAWFYLAAVQALISPGFFDISETPDGGYILRDSKKWAEVLEKTSTQRLGN